MRIQTRLFLGTALLVLSLTGTQWWLHRQQLASLEREVGTVAQAVGKGLLEERVEVLVHTLPDTAPGEVLEWVEHGGGAENGIREREVRRVERVLRLPRPAPGGVGDTTGEAPDGGDLAPSEDRADTGAGTIELHVTTLGGPGPRFLVVSDGSGRVRRIPIPVSPIQRVVRDTSHRGLAVGGVLLLLGLVAAGVQARRLSRPLEGLAAGAEAVGRGERGVQVAEDGAGEIGELQRAFNRMSARLASLESERERWLVRERLAQLGDLSRGLAHTLRNPLNTLGLAVEELADGRADAAGLVGTARSQIRRIDRWLRSFLALAAGEAAEPKVVDAREVAADVALEVSQDGAPVDLRSADRSLPVLVVPTALRAAIANLVENAVEASPDGSPVELEVRQDGPSVVVTVADRGPGLPPDVRARLFSPHVTTKGDGSGMGLFLARQLVVDMHGGTLEVTDRAAGGTVAEVRLNLHDTHDSP